MIFKVNRDEFTRAIKPAVDIACKNVLKDFKYEKMLTIKAEQDKIIMCAYGGSMSLIAPISDSNYASLDYSCEVEGQATVYANDLLTFMLSLPNNYDKVKISLESNQLKIVSASDKKVDSDKDKKINSSERKMATLPSEVIPPRLGETFDQEIEIDREVFIDGIGSVIFAPSYEEKQYSYMCMLFEAKLGSDQELRFSAGSGGRFAIKSVKGKSIIFNQQEARMIFPKNSLAPISNILSGSSSETVTIKSIGADQVAHIPEHIMIEFDEMKMCIFGLEHFTKYPDLNKILQHQYSNRIYSSLEDWKPIEMTIDGTKHRWSNSIHNTDVVVEQDDEVIMVTPRTPNTSPTFVGMVDVKECIIKGDKIWFRCNSDYLREMSMQGSGKGSIQLNFESQSDLDGITDEKQQQKLMKPVLVKFPENVDSVKNIVDNFYMFFSISTK